jgi:hypothetical protein
MPTRGWRERERERERENWEKTRTMIVRQEEVWDVPGLLRDIPRGFWGCCSTFAGCLSAAFARCCATCAWLPVPRGLQLSFWDQRLVSCHFWDPPNLPAGRAARPFFVHFGSSLLLSSSSSMPLCVLGGLRKKKTGGSGGVRITSSLACKTLSSRCENQNQQQDT